MADKFMKIGGRGESGGAKELRTDDQGNLKTQLVEDATKESSLKLDNVGTWATYEAVLEETLDGGHKLYSTASSQFARVTDVNGITKINIADLEKHAVEFGLYIHEMKSSADDNTRIEIRFYNTKDTSVGGYRTKKLYQNIGWITFRENIPADAVSAEIRIYTDKEGNYIVFSKPALKLIKLNSADKTSEIINSLEYKTQPLALTENAWSDWVNVLDNSSSYVTIFGRIDLNENIDMQIEMQPFFALGGVDSKNGILTAKVRGRRFLSDPIPCYTSDFRVRFKTQESVNITNLYIKDFSGTQSSTDSLNVTDRNGNSVALTAEVDNENKGVLRTVDASPHAYDEANNVLRVVNLKESEPIGSHRTVELIWDDASLTGQIKFGIDLNGNKDFIRGTKGFIVYKGLADGHSIYFEYRIGGSGALSKDYIVEDGIGTGNNQTMRVKIPEDYFPIIDFGDNIYGSANKLVFESNGTDMHKLRAYLVVM